MKVIGLCGGSGSGKGTVAKIFSSFNIPSIDADKVYHEITSTAGPCLYELEREFGSRIVSGGALDRAALRNIVFTGSDAKEKQEKLNRITHKYVLDEIRRRIDSYRREGCHGVIIDMPLLFECGFNAECDYTISVTADTNLRIARIMIRDSIDYDTAYNRIKLQKNDSWLAENTDFTIKNDGDFDLLYKQVELLYKQIFVNKF